MENSGSWMEAREWEVGASTPNSHVVHHSSWFFDPRMRFSITNGVLFH